MEITKKNKYAKKKHKTNKEMQINKDENEQKIWET